VVVLHWVEANEFKISVQSLVHHELHFVVWVVQNCKQIYSASFSSNHSLHDFWISAAKIARTNSEEFGQFVHVEGAVVGADN